MKTRRLREPTFKCTVCGLVSPSYVYVSSHGKFHTNFETWFKGRKVFTLCLDCSRQKWQALLWAQEIGARVEMIVRPGIAMTLAATLAIHMSGNTFTDAGGGVWRALCEPKKFGAKVWFEKVSRSNNKQKGQ